MGIPAAAANKVALEIAKQAGIGTALVRHFYLTKFTLRYACVERG
jgi:hypothetical protein